VIPETRLGVRLPPLKARLFDLVMRAGPDGIDRHELFNIAFDDDAHARRHRYSTLKSHILQINELIGDTGFRIEGYPQARLVKRRPVI
jgi:hypothetical protein